MAEMVENGIKYLPIPKVLREPSFGPETTGGPLLPLMNSIKLVSELFFLLLPNKYGVNNLHCFENCHSSYV